MQVTDDDDKFQSMVTEEFPAEMLKSYLDSMYKVKDQWVSDFVLAHSIAQPLMNTVSVFFACSISR